MTTRSLWRGRALALAGVVLVAFSLRSAVAALSPILTEVQADFAVPAWIAGLIGTAPPVCFAVFGIVTPALERRFGLERLAAASMVVVTLALLGRAVAGEAGTLLAGVTLVTRERAGARRADAAVTASGAPAPVDIDEPAPRVLGRLPRLPLAWALAITFAISSASVYALFAWLPAILVEHAGVSHAAAGALLSLFGAMGLPWSILVPIVLTRWRRVGVLYAVALVAGLAGVAGMMFAPTAATVLWVVLLGTPQGLFPAVLVLIQLRARTHEGAVALSGFTQSVGYAIAALFPLSFGILHEATSGWAPALLLLGLLFLATIPAGLIVARPHTIEDEWERRHGAW